MPDDAQIKQLHDIIHGIGNGKTPAGLGGMNLAPSSKKKGGKMSAAEIQLEQQRKMLGGGTKTKNARTLEAKSELSAMIHGAKLGGYESVRLIQRDRI